MTTACLPGDRGTAYSLPLEKTDSIPRCPDLWENKQALGYAFNRHLESASLARLESPHGVPLAYDSSNLARDAADYMMSLLIPGRHSKRNFIVQADTSAKAYPHVVPED